MTTEAFYFCLICIALLAILYYSLKLKIRELDRGIQDFNKRIDGIVEKREKFYYSLTDPVLIEAEMEKSARMREMRDANRTTLPRDDAGPPAKVYRPKLRSPQPSRWNPPSA